VLGQYEDRIRGGHGAALIFPTSILAPRSFGSQVEVRVLVNQLPFFRADRVLPLLLIYLVFSPSYPVLSLPEIFFHVDWVVLTPASLFPTYVFYISEGFTSSNNPVVRACAFARGYIKGSNIFCQICFPWLVHNMSSF
jgi:hypothetical protein